MCFLVCLNDCTPTCGDAVPRFRSTKYPNPPQETEAKRKEGKANQTAPRTQNWCSRSGRQRQAALRHSSLYRMRRPVADGLHPRHTSPLTGRLVRCRFHAVALWSKLAPKAESHLRVVTWLDCQTLIPHFCIDGSQSRSHTGRWPWWSYARRSNESSRRRYALKIRRGFGQSAYSSANEQRSMGSAASKARRRLEHGWASDAMQVIILIEANALFRWRDAMSRVLCRKEEKDVQTQVKSASY